MKIYFSQVPHDDIDNFGDEGLLGPNKDGEFFYNQVEFGTNPGGIDEVTISDGCNRSIPICVDTIPDLMTALAQCYNMKRMIDFGDNVTAVAESNEEVYVQDDEIHFNGESIQKVISSVRS
jgi:hypothetical protein